MCADSALYRTGEAAKFLLCLNVIVSTAHSVVERHLSSWYPLVVGCIFIRRRTIDAL